MTEEASTLPWTFRLAETTRAPLPLIGLGVAVAYLCFFVLVHNLAGGMDGLRMEGRPFWLHPLVGSAACAYALLLGYLVVAVGYVMRSASAGLRDLSPALALSPSGIAEFDVGLRRIDPWRLRLIGVAGIAFQTAMNVWFFAGVAPESRPQPWDWWITFLTVQDFVFIWIAWRLMAILFVVALRFSDLGERHAIIDLFDFQSIQPFTQLGLSLALLVLIGFAISMPSMVGFITTTDVAMFITYGGTMVGIPAILAATLVILPLRGVHRAIVKAKGSALERVRSEVAQEHEAILANDEERKTLATQRLPGLLAHEARLERVKEWSLDFPAFLRFALYVLIPLGSWVAAAVVERALGAALG
jgi:hypothetical protein